MVQVLGSLLPMQEHCIEVMTPDVDPTQPWTEVMTPDADPTQPWTEDMAADVGPTQPWIEVMTPDADPTQPNPGRCMHLGSDLADSCAHSHLLIH